ncbi:MAG: translation initiation factor IF-2 [Planctomycetes bacterium]|nr:translation initiation factor IF-2 [Planctomycetota bacterium]
MTKKRVFEIAKEYGMKGVDLVKKLQELGFEKVRNPMSALDEFELLQIQARLELSGIIPETSAPAEQPEAKTQTFRRKPKKAAPATAAETAIHPTVADETPAAPIVESAHAHAIETVRAPKSAPELIHHEAASPETAPETTHPLPASVHYESPETAEAEVQREAAADEMPQAPPAEFEVEVATEPAGEIVDSTIEAGAEAAVSTVITESVEVATTPEAVLDAAASAPAHESVDKEKSSVSAAPRPTNTELRPRRPPLRPAAKIVGKIDLTLLKQKQSAQTAARQAAQQQQQPAAAQQAPGSNATQGGINVSGSEADVRPMFKHNRQRVLTRSDVSQSRDRLTAAQMREKEQQRVRRLTGPQKGGLGTMSNRTPTSGGGGGGGGSNQSTSAPREKIVRRSQIVLNPPVTIRSLSEALGLKVGDLTKTLMMTFKRVQLNPNITLTDEDAKLLALEHGFDIEIHAAATAEEAIRAERTRVDLEDSPNMEPRAPVIAFLGHVDHGKTSLIDAIRQTNVAAGEAGGITQHIGAYRVTTKSGRPITILDTPGHEAFTEMRKRGAQATDIVILVVAADDGVMPQTEEAHAHAKAAGVPIIVALNKSDKATDQQKEKTIGQLASIGLAPEIWHGNNWGGHTAVIETSATKKIGVEDLLERVALEAEVLDLKANPERNPEGLVIEAQKSGQRGIVATLLVQKGTLRPGDIILAGAGYGRVRNIYDDRGRPLELAGPSIPAEVTGLSELPSAGDHFVIVDELSQAQEAAEDRARKMRERDRAGQMRDVSIAGLFSRIKEGQAKELKIVLKADVGGSLEVLKKQLDSIASKDPLGNEIHVKVIFAAVGAITEADVNLAAASNGMVVGFHVLAPDSVKKLGQREGVEVRVYQILYELSNDIKKLMEGLVSLVEREVVIGHADVRQTFRSSKFGTIAGCMVSDGQINRSSSVRVMRNGAAVYKGKIDSLRRLKDDVREVKTGFECGVKIGGYDDIKTGDVLEFFEIKEEKPELTDI